MSATRRRADTGESCAIPTERAGVFIMRFRPGFRREVIKIIDQCYWCNKRIYLKKGFLNTATIDHLYSRWDARRKQPENARICVLACEECNIARADLEQEMTEGEAALESRPWRKINEANQT